MLDLDSAMLRVSHAWRQHEAELLGFLTHRLGNQAMAEDVLQNVFVNTICHARDFCLVDNPRAWLFQVARRCLIDDWRKTRELVELPEDLMDVPLTRAPVDELDKCLLRNLSEMTSEDREIVQACDLQDQTVREFATTHQLSLSAAKSRLLRARQRLRQALVDNCRVRFDAQGKVCCHLPREPRLGHRRNAH